MKSSAASLGSISATFTSSSSVISVVIALRVVIMTVTDAASGRKYLKSIYDLSSSSSIASALSKTTNHLPLRL
jgi:hypothetical protein